MSPGDTLFRVSEGGAKCQRDVTWGMTTPQWHDTSTQHEGGAQHDAREAAQGRDGAIK